MTLTFVEAGPDDFTAIAALWFRAQAARRSASFATLSDSRALVALRAAEAGSWFILASEDERTVGFAHGVPGRKNDGLGKPIRGLLQLGMIAVEPSEWGHGIGKRLMERCFEIALERDYHKLQLWTHADNVRAQRLCEGLGFTRTGRIKLDPRGETIVQYGRSTTGDR